MDAGPEGPGTGTLSQWCDAIAEGREGGRKAYGSREGELAEDLSHSFTSYDTILNEWSTLKCQR